MNIGTTHISFNGLYMKTDENDKNVKGKTFDNDIEVIELLQKKIEDNGKIRNPALLKRKGTEEPGKATFTLNDRFEITAETHGDDGAHRLLGITKVDSSKCNHYITIGDKGNNTEGLRKRLVTFVDFLFAKVAEALVQDQEKANNTVIDLLTEETDKTKTGPTYLFEQIL